MPHPPTGGGWQALGWHSRLALEGRGSVVKMGSTAGLPQFLTVDEVAALLRTSRKAIYAMVERGQLPGVTRVRRRLLVRAEELVDWLNQSRVPSLEE